MDNGDAPAEEKTFVDDDFAVTFRYPSSFTEGEVVDVARSVGGKPAASAALQLDTYDGIVVSKYLNAAPVGPEDMVEVLPVFNSQVSQLVEKQVTGSIVDIAGLPGIRYDDLDVPGRVNQKSRLVFLFDGRDQYLLNCQSTAEHRDELTRACDRALATVRHR